MSKKTNMQDRERVWWHRSTNALTRREFLANVGAGAILALAAGGADASDDIVTLPDIRSVPRDLAVPPVSPLPPGPGTRVRQSLPGYEHTEVHHTLYLPRDWEPGRRYPVLVEYPGNGPYLSPYGDYSSGDVEDCTLGYGISGGQGFVWVALPFVNSTDKTNQRRWWGDVNATLAYCKNAVVDVCERFGGDNGAVILCGFSRGAIACNYIGLHNREMADIWLAFIACSHYDGVRAWNWLDSGRASALERLKRLDGRATFIAQEVSIADIRNYLKTTGVKAPFRLKAIPCRNHTNGWILCDIPVRRALRSWLNDTLSRRPGVHEISGRLLDVEGRPVESVRIQSGDTHWSFTAANGEFVLRGLIASERTVVPVKDGTQFRPHQLSVEVGRKSVAHLQFRML